MAVDQARHLNLFNTNSIQQIDNNNNNNSFVPYPMNDSSFLLPFYGGFNDVVFQKLPPPPAVKDDSGVTFNNSFVPPSSSRKRQRDSPAMISNGAPLLAVNPTTTIIATNTCSSNVKEQSSNGFSFLGEDLSLQIMQQQLELDRFISQHMEKMRMEIEGRKKQQLRRMMAAIEESMAKRLRDKEEEIEKIGKVNWALEERVKTLCLENQIWRELAQTNEATAIALRSNLEQVLAGNHRTASEDLADDAVSCCGSSGGGGEEERENEDEEENRLGKRVKCGGGEKWIYRGKSNCGGEKNRMCRKCREGESSVLLLPCRHLCLCTSCGPKVNACPICGSTKNASVHVNLS